jgi:hypothetical protein
MNNFNKIVIIQLLIYWMIAPVISIITGEANYQYWSVFPYLFALLIYIYSSINNSKYKNGITFNISFSDYRVLCVIFLLLCFMHSSSEFGRLPFGEAQSRNASFGFHTAIIHKLCEIAFPLYFCLQVNKKKLININILIMVFCIYGSFLNYGPSKSIIIFYFFIFLIFNNSIKINFLRFTLFSMLIALTFIAIFLIRNEQSSMYEVFLYFINRLDGIRLVSEDPLGKIDFFNSIDMNYLYPYFYSVSRFVDPKALDIFAAGLINIKAIYLNEIGYSELDTTISFPSELIMLTGYFPGLVISLLLLIFLRNYAFKAISSPKILKFAIGYSILSSIMIMESSAISFIINPIKLMPLVIIALLPIIKKYKL